MKILCIGRNYSDHAKELNNPIPEEPVVFAKPDSAILPAKQAFYIPDFSQNIQHELELIVKISRNGKHIGEKFAHKYYNEVTVGIDFTARDVQSELKSKGLPWEKAKGFDGSAVVGRFMPLSELGNIQDLSMRLNVNGSDVQKGHTGDMIFTVNGLIAHLSTYYTLRQGDLIFTGTPSGVNSVNLGDHLKGYLNEVELFELDVK